MTSTEIIDEVISREQNSELSRTFLLGLLNHVYLQLCSKVRKLARGYFTAIDTTTIVGNGSTKTFNLPENFRQIVRLLDGNGNEVKGSDWGHDGWRLLGGTISGASYRQQIYFDTAPTETLTLIYEFSPAELDESVNTVPYFIADYHEALVVGTMSKLHANDDDIELKRQIRNEYIDLESNMLEEIAEREQSGEGTIEVPDEDLE